MYGKRNKIREIREKMLLTQEEFAKLLGVSRQTVYFWESGKCEISKDNLEKIKEIKKKRD